jgi:hypothetical protein
MKRERTFVRLGLVAFGFAASLSVAVADEAPAPVPNLAPVVNEALSLQGFGAQNPLCREWGDDCSICLRDDKDAAHCSTPGVACQPASIVCRQAKTP